MAVNVTGSTTQPQGHGQAEERRHRGSQVGDQHGQDGLQVGPRVVQGVGQRTELPAQRVRTIHRSTLRASRSLIGDTRAGPAFGASPIRHDDAPVGTGASLNDAPPTLRPHHSTKTARAAGQFASGRRARARRTASCTMPSAIAATLRCSCWLSVAEPG